MLNCNGKNSSFILILTSPSGYFGIFKNCSLWKCVVELTTWFRSSFVAQKKKNLELEEMSSTVPLIWCLIQNVPYSCPYSIGLNLLIRTFSVLIEFMSFHKIFHKLWVILMNHQKMDDLGGRKYWNGRWVFCFGWKSRF